MSELPRLRKPVWFESVASTNSWLKSELDGGAPIEAGTVVAARNQTGGRGRKNRGWISGPGNLAFSIYWMSERALDEAPSLSMAIAAAVVRWLDTHGIHGELKWPNDVLVGGQKIAGILAEMAAGDPQRLHIVVGVGINLNMSAEACAAIERPATSLRVVSGNACEAEEALECLLPFVEDVTVAWEQYGFNSIRDFWKQRAYRLHGVIEVVEDAQRRRGIFCGVGRRGELIMDENGTQRAVTLGDVL